MYSIRTQGKFVKAKTKYLFIRNRELQITRRFIGITLAILMIIGAYLADYLNEPIVYSVVRASDVYASRGEERTSNDATARGYDVITPAEEEPSPLSAEDIEAKIRAVFGEEGDIAVAVAKCESSLIPSRIGDTHMAHYSVGLFQINQTWHKYSDETLKDPDENIRIAKEIRDRWGNWRAWTCFKNDGYKKHLY